jgi:hypothetical protein
LVSFIVSLLLFSSSPLLLFSSRLSSSQVLSETVDLPKTYNTVYGIGPGSAIDSEILVFMKSRGWPERVQVGMLMSLRIKPIVLTAYAY